MSRGVLLAAFNCADTLDDCLKPWLEVKEELGLVISAVSVPFAEYREIGGPVDCTREKLDSYLASGCIDFLTTEPQFVAEAVARDLALRPLLSSGVSDVTLLDGDELYSVKDIRGLYKFVDKVDDVCWLSVPLKNIVFDGQCWVDGFAPPRVFRTHYGNLTLEKCYYDNDFLYARDDGVEFDYKNLPKAVVAKAVCHPRHMTWLNSERSYRKVEYQRQHFGHCSYRRNGNSIEFDPDYYAKVGQPMPEIRYDDRL